VVVKEFGVAGSFAWVSTRDSLVRLLKSTQFSFYIR